MVGTRSKRDIPENNEEPQSKRSRHAEPTYLVDLEKDARDLQLISEDLQLQASNLDQTAQNLIRKQKVIDSMREKYSEEDATVQNMHQQNEQIKIQLCDVEKELKEAKKDLEKAETELKSIKERACTEEDEKQVAINKVSQLTDKIAGFEQEKITYKAEMNQVQDKLIKELYRLMCERSKDAASMAAELAQSMVIRSELENVVFSLKEDEQKALKEAENSLKSAYALARAKVLQTLEEWKARDAVQHTEDASVSDSASEITFDYKSNAPPISHENSEQEYENWISSDNDDDKIQPIWNFLKDNGMDLDTAIGAQKFLNNQTYVQKNKSKKSIKFKPTQIAANFIWHKLNHNPERTDLRFISFVHYFSNVLKRKSKAGYHLTQARVHFTGENLDNRLIPQ